MLRSIQHHRTYPQMPLSLFVIALLFSVSSLTYAGDELDNTVVEKAEEVFSAVSHMNPQPCEQDEKSEGFFHSTFFGTHQQRTSFTGHVLEADAVRNQYHFKVNQVEIPTGGGFDKLKGRYFECVVEGKNPVNGLEHGCSGKTVVIMTGTHEPNELQSKEMIKLLLQNKVNVLAVDYRGFGHSPGVPNETNLYQDGRAMLDFLVQDKHIDPKTITLWGYSMGGAVASYVAAQNPDVRLILDRTLASRKAAIKANLPWVLTPFARFMGYKAIGSLNTKENVAQIIKSQDKRSILFISGGAEDVLTQQNQKLFQKAKTNKKGTSSPHQISQSVIPDADHFDTERVIEKSCTEILGLIGILPDQQDCQFK